MPGLAESVSRGVSSLTTKQAQDVLKRKYTKKKKRKKKKKKDDESDFFGFAKRKRALTGK